MWMNGDPSVGENITPLSDYWTKSEMTTIGRRQDWVECGGMNNGNYGISPAVDTTKEIQAESQKKNNQLQICMLGKGYQYTRECKSDVSKNFPACLNR